MSAMIGRPDGQIATPFFKDNFRRVYRTPEGLDDLLMTSDGAALTGLRFIAEEGQCFVEKHAHLPVFRETVKWLDDYFAGHPKEGIPAIRVEGLTEFREEVLRILQRIPFGETVTYGDIAKEIAHKRYPGSMSAQAVGQAVGWNPICILIPCHRVMGGDGSLTGYGGGIENKRWLLRHEGGLLL